MTRRATFTQAELVRAAKVARDAGVSVTIESADGQRVIVSPLAEPRDKRDDDVLDEVEMARTICFAWGHCAGGCQFKGARCLGDADSLLHGWQGRCANSALARLREARGK